MSRVMLESSPCGESRKTGKQSWSNLETSNRKLSPNYFSNCGFLSQAEVHAELRAQKTELFRKLKLLSFTHLHTTGSRIGMNGMGHDAGLLNHIQIPKIKFIDPFYNEGVQSHAVEPEHRSDTAGSHPTVQALFSAGPSSYSKLAYCLCSSRGAGT